MQVHVCKSMLFGNLLTLSTQSTQALLSNCAKSLCSFSSVRLASSEHTATISATTTLKDATPSTQVATTDTPDLFASSVSDTSKKKAENISRAMSYYLEKLKEREKIMAFRTQEYEVGKRHLAKMMGEDVDKIDQSTIDKLIEYLLPSSLSDKKARPFLKHPKDYYPTSKLAYFDVNGRPLHFMFYTGNHVFYQLTYDIIQKIQGLDKLNDALFLVKTKIHHGLRDDFSNETKVDTSNSVWISHLNLCKKLKTDIDEFNYNKCIILLQKLADHPLSKREEEFLKEFQVPFEPAIKLSSIKDLLTDEKGVKYQIALATQRTAKVEVKLCEGTGKVNIKAPEGQFSITFFDSMIQREQLLFPFKAVDRINKFDLDVKVNNGGMSCLAKAIRYAISKCLCSFVSVSEIEKLRLAGLLSADRRTKERKKPGQEGARRRYTWKKR